jgi:hypothetical protein
MLREQSAVYEPEDLSLLGGIFDRVVTSLPVAMRTPVKRTEIARNILTCAAAGERNPSKLELAALMIRPQIRSSLSAPRITILSAVSGNGRVTLSLHPTARASKHRALHR